MVFYKVGLDIGKRLEIEKGHDGNWVENNQNTYACTNTLNESHFFVLLIWTNKKIRMV